MSDPMTPERRAEIREHLARTRDLNVCVDDWHLTLAGDADNLLAEVERLRAELDNLQDADSEATVWHDEFQRAKAERDEAREQLAAFVPPGTLGAGETPALCGTCKELLCVPGLPGCAHCVAAEVERLRAEQDIDRQALDRAAADHAQLRVEVTDERRHHADYVRQIETERDAAREQVKRVRAEHPQETDAQDRPVCGACRDAYEEPVPWPCPTISALDGTEPGR